MKLSRLFYVRLINNTYHRIMMYLKHYNLQLTKDYKLYDKNAKNSYCKFALEDKATKQIIFETYDIGSLINYLENYKR